MKRQHKNILHKCYQTGSFLLVLLFLSISIIQALHSHKKEVQTEQSSGDEDAVSDSDDCKLCYYFTHKQGKQLFLHYPPVLVLSLPEPVNFSTEIFIGNYKFTLQGFTNKGPPALIG